MLKSWYNTPWMPSCSVKGRGADCIGFVSGVLDELYRKPFGALGSSPVGLSHQSNKFMAFAEKALRIWPLEKSETVGPGDLVLSRESHGHAHLYITGAVPHSLWHCMAGQGVCYGGFGSITASECDLTFYRLRGKDTWV